MIVERKNLEERLRIETCRVSSVEGEQIESEPANDRTAAVLSRSACYVEETCEEFPAVLNAAAAAAEDSRGPFRRDATLDFRL
jgi:hypothetical protein